MLAAIPESSQSSRSFRRFLLMHAIVGLTNQGRCIAFPFHFGQTFADPFNLCVIEWPVFSSPRGNGVRFPCCGKALPSSQCGQDRITFCVGEIDYHSVEPGSCCSSLGRAVYTYI